MSKKIKGFDRNHYANVGDKHLKIVNPDDTSCTRIFIVDDVYELSPRENAYECTVKTFEFFGSIKDFSRCIN